MSDIERAIDRLRDRLGRAGVPDVSAPAGTRALDELARAIHPDTTSAALAGDRDAAERAAHELVTGVGPQGGGVVASAVRPAG